MVRPAERRTPRAFLAVLGSLAVVAAAQQPAADAAAKVAAAAEKWLASDQVDDELLGATVRVFGEHPKLAVDWLAPQLEKTAPDVSTPRAKGVRTLCTQFALEYLRLQRATDLSYVGQYDLLARLQPYVGDLFFELLLATPQWFPLTFRWQLVAPLRDLQAKPPSAERLDGIVAIVEDADEPEELRRALAAALWQWGTRQYGEAVLQKLQQDIANGDGEDRVNSTLHLADFLVSLRDYKQAANAHRSAQVLARQNRVPLRPVAWYAAACVHALLGDVEKGFAALDECTRLLASKDLDESLRLQPSMFADDPELALLRKDPRFSAMVARALPPEPGKKVPESRPGR